MRKGTFQGGGFPFSQASKFVNVRLRKNVSLLLALILAVTACSKDEEPEEPTPSVLPPTTDVIDTKAGVLNGYFAVSDSKKVRFSQGNLCYLCVGSHQTVDGIALGVFLFAKNQYETRGVTNTVFYAGSTDTIDLFGWGTSGYHKSNDPFNTQSEPYSISADSILLDSGYFSPNTYGYGPSYGPNDTAFSGKNEQFDWGVYNAIKNGGNAPGMWRTLSLQEWNYLLTKRTNAQKKAAHGCIIVNGRTINGLILLPDEFNRPSGCKFTAGNASGFNTNKYSKSKWKKMEKAGAVFLPAAGMRTTQDLQYYGTLPFYWTATATSYSCAAALRGFGYSLYTTVDNPRYCGYAVRLVRE